MNKKSQQVIHIKPLPKCKWPPGAIAVGGVKKEDAPRCSDVLCPECYGREE